MSLAIPTTTTKRLIAAIFTTLTMCRNPAHPRGHYRVPAYNPRHLPSYLGPGLRHLAVDQIDRLLHLVWGALCGQRLGTVGHAALEFKWVR